MAAVQTRDLTRAFGAKLGCAGITLTVPRGGIFSLLGRNGAGKSTLVKMLVGLLHPTSGEAVVLDRPAGHVEARRAIGFLPENFRYPDWATGTEVLGFHAALAGLAPLRRRARIAAVLDMVGLRSDARRLVGGYSKGMQQRLGIACALLADPQLIFLDEPTSALDPLGRREMRELLLRLRDEGKTIFLNSHLLSEIELISDRVAVIRDGRLVAEGSLPQLLEGTLEAEVRLEPGDAAGLEAVAARARILGQEAGEGLLRLRVAVHGREDVPALAEAVVRAGGRLHGLQTRTRSLEDVFVELVSPRAGSGRT